MSIYDDAQSIAAELIDEFANPYSTVTVKRLVSVPDGQGGYSTTLSDAYTGLKTVVVTSGGVGSEKNANARINHEPETTFYLKYSDCADLSSADKIEFGGELYEIKDPSDISKARAAWRVTTRKNST